MRANVYAAGALALSAGLSVHTFASLPRGGVAGAWQTSSPRAASALRDAPAPRSLRRGRSRLSKLVSGAAAALGLAPGRSAGAASRQERPARPASIFASRPAALAPRPVERPRVDGTTLLRAGAGPDRIVDYAGAYAGYEPVGAGRLEGFRWQPPRSVGE